MFSHQTIRVRDRSGHWAGGIGETVMLEIGQVGRYIHKSHPMGTSLSLRLHDLRGSAFDTIKVYIDCYRGAAAVSAGLLPGAVCVLYMVSIRIQFCGLLTL